MIFDKIFKDKFLDALRSKAKEQGTNSISTYNVVYNQIMNNKIKITFNYALLKHDSSKGLASYFGESNDYFDDIKYKNIQENVHDLLKKEKTKNDSSLFSKLDYYTNPLNIKPASLAKGTWNLTKKAGKGAINFLTGWDIKEQFKVSGGYDPNKKIIKLVVWFYTGLEPERLLFDELFPKIYSLILASILHEGLYIYNFKSNGNSLDSQVSNWYKHYFVNSMMQHTGRSTISKFCGNYLGESWPKYMYENVEKFIVNGNEPYFKEKIIGDYKKEPLVRNPLIKEYVKKSPIDNLRKNVLPDRYDLDKETLDVVEAYFKDLIEFIVFMYTYRNKQFSPKAIGEMPEFDYFLKNFGSNGWKDKTLGFKIIGEPKTFDDAYDDVYGLKDVYSSGFNNFFKKNYVYSEMFMPTTIQSKLVYYSTLRNVKLEEANSNIRLIDYAIKGISSL